MTRMLPFGGSEHLSPRWTIRDTGIPPWHAPRRDPRKRCAYANGTRCLVIDRLPDLQGKTPRKRWRRRSARRGSVGALEVLALSAALPADMIVIENELGKERHHGCPLCAVGCRAERA